MNLYNLYLVPNIHLSKDLQWPSSFIFPHFYFLDQLFYGQLFIILGNKGNKWQELLN